MQTAHEIIRSYVEKNAVDMAAFDQWFLDGGYPQDHANVHDSRYLDLLDTFVDERDAERIPTA